MAITTASYRYVIAAALTISAASSVQAKTPPKLHLEMEMDGRDYLNLWQKLDTQGHMAFVGEKDPLWDILEIGKRNLQWLDIVNAARSDDQKLELSTPETQIGYPMDAPRESNRTIVDQSFKDAKAAMPKAILDVLLSSDPLLPQVPTDDETFLTHIRVMDRIYQAASRWLLQEPHLFQYENFSQNDIRGYYFLSREENLAEKLAQWHAQSPEVQQKLGGWIIGMCRNTGESISVCRSEFKAAVVAPKTPVAYYNKYLEDAKTKYQDFFSVMNPRKDARYDPTTPDQFVLPFIKPEQADVQDWLDVNIEDEWRFGNFQLSLNFLTGSSLRHPYVVFVPGVTPNVNGLGGSKITMDANRNIQEYTSRWTIRHEFGHVLGFPDCYVEFYDGERKVMVNYQLDITNLMCSRRGHLQEQHLKELQKAYWIK